MLLTWNNFSQTTISTFKDLGTSKDFSDVTLACGDGQQVESHKVVLSASSPVFRSILINTSHTHPYIYMKGMDKEELDLLIQFMYFGEVMVQKDHLEKFLECATELKIAGLATNNEKNGGNRGISETNREGGLVKFEQNPEIQDSVCQECQKTFSTPANLKSHNTSMHERVEHSCPICKFKSNFSGNLKKHMRQIHTEDSNYSDFEETSLKEEESTNSCDQCGIENKSGKALMKHRQEEHPGKMFSCNVCGKELSTNSNLKSHKKSIHQLIRFPCEICTKEFANASNLVAHIKKHTKEDATQE